LKLLQIRVRHRALLIGLSAKGRAGRQLPHPPQRTDYQASPVPPSPVPASAFGSVTPVASASSEPGSGYLTSPLIEIFRPRTKYSFSVTEALPVDLSTTSSGSSTWRKPAQVLVTRRSLKCIGS